MMNRAEFCKQKPYNECVINLYLYIIKNASISIDYFVDMVKWQNFIQFLSKSNCVLNNQIKN